MLKQQINLYQFFAPPIPTDRIITWERLWLSNLFLIFFLIIIYFFSLWNTHSLKLHQVEMEEKVILLKNRFTQIKDTYPSLFFSPDVSKSVAQFKQEVIAQEKILASIVNQTSFSQYLITLGQIIIPNVWLTEMDFTKGGNTILLKGQSQTMENLQTFLSNIGREKIFLSFNLNVNNIENKDNDKQKVANNLAFDINLVKKQL